jgi:hypothetical protein
MLNRNNAAGYNDPGAIAGTTDIQYNTYTVIRITGDRQGVSGMSDSGTARILNEEQEY